MSEDANIPDVLAEEAKRISDSLAMNAKRMDVVAQQIESLSVLEKLQCEGEAPDLSTLTDEEVKQLYELGMSNRGLNGLPDNHAHSLNSIKDRQSANPPPPPLTRAQMEQGIQDALQARGLQVSAVDIAAAQIETAEGLTRDMGGKYDKANQDIMNLSEKAAEMGVPLDVSGLKSEAKDYKAQLTDFEQASQGAVNSMASRPGRLDLQRLSQGPHTPEDVQACINHNKEAMGARQMDLRGVDMSNLQVEGVRFKGCRVDENMAPKQIEDIRQDLEAEKALHEQPLPDLDRLSKIAAVNGQLPDLNSLDRQDLEAAFNHVLKSPNHRMNSLDPDNPFSTESLEGAQASDYTDEQLRDGLSALLQKRAGVGEPLDAARVMKVQNAETKEYINERRNNITDLQREYENLAADYPQVAAPELAADLAQHSAAVESFAKHDADQRLLEIGGKALNDQLSQLGPDASAQDVEACFRNVTQSLSVDGDLRFPAAGIPPGTDLSTAKLNKFSIDSETLARCKGLETVKGVEPRILAEAQAMKPHVERLDDLNSRLGKLENKGGSVMANLRNLRHGGVKGEREHLQKEIEKAQQAKAQAKAQVAGEYPVEGVASAKEVAKVARAQEKVHASAAGQAAGKEAPKGIPEAGKIAQPEDLAGLSANEMKGAMQASETFQVNAAEGKVIGVGGETMGYAKLQVGERSAMLQVEASAAKKALVEAGLTESVLTKVEGRYASIAKLEKEIKETKDPEILKAKQDLLEMTKQNLQKELNQDLENIPDDQRPKVDALLKEFDRVQVSYTSAQMADSSSRGAANALFKPETGYGQSFDEAKVAEIDKTFLGRSAASYETDLLIGTNVCSEEKLGVNDQGQLIGISVAADGAQVSRITPVSIDGKDDLTTRFLRTDYASHEVQKGLYDLEALDYITGQIDRHPGNIVIDPASGSVKGIDNDLAFPEDDRANVLNRGNKAVVNLPMFMHKDTAEKIAAVTPEQLREKLSKIEYPDNPGQPVLTPDEIEGAVTRLQEMQEHIKKLEAEGKIVTTFDQTHYDQAVAAQMEALEGYGPNAGKLSEGEKVSPDNISNLDIKCPKTSYIGAIEVARLEAEADAKKLGLARPLDCPANEAPRSAEYSAAKSAQVALQQGMSPEEAREVGMQGVQKRYDDLVEKVQAQGEKIENLQEQLKQMPPGQTAERRSLNLELQDAYKQQDNNLRSLEKCQKEKTAVATKLVADSAQSLEQRQQKLEAKLAQLQEQPTGVDKLKAIPRGGIKGEIAQLNREIDAIKLERQAVLNAAGEQIGKDDHREKAQIDTLKQSAEAAKIQGNVAVEVKNEAEEVKNEVAVEVKNEEPEEEIKLELSAEIPLTESQILEIENEFAGLEKDPGHIEIDDVDDDHGITITEVPNVEENNVADLDAQQPEIPLTPVQVMTASALADLGTNKTGKQVFEMIENSDLDPAQKQEVFLAVSENIVAESCRNAREGEGALRSNTPGTQFMSSYMNAYASEYVDAVGQQSLEAIQNIQLPAEGFSRKGGDAALTPENVPKPGFVNDAEDSMSPELAQQWDQVYYQAGMAAVYASEAQLAKLSPEAQAFLKSLGDTVRNVTPAENADNVAMMVMANTVSLRAGLQNSASDGSNLQVAGDTAEKKIQGRLLTNASIVAQSYVNNLPKDQKLGNEKPQHKIVNMLREEGLNDSRAVMKKLSQGQLPNTPQNELAPPDATQKLNAAIPGREQRLITGEGPKPVALPPPAVQAPAVQAPPAVAQQHQQDGHSSGRPSVRDMLSGAKHVVAQKLGIDTESKLAKVEKQIEKRENHLADLKERSADLKAQLSDPEKQAALGKKYDPDKAMKGNTAERNEQMDIAEARAIKKAADKLDSHIKNNQEKLGKLEMKQAKLEIKSHQNQQGKGAKQAAVAAH